MNDQQGNRMNRSHRLHLACALAASFLVWPSAQAWSPFSVQPSQIQAADSSTSKPAQKPKKEKKASGKKGGGVTFYEGSGETRAERDKRLMRECKGRPNAGLCEGYANP
jgi:hypothetical protein